VPRSRLRPPARNRRSAHRRETRGCHRTRVAIARRRYPPTPGQGSASVHAIWRRWAPRRRGGSAVRYCSCTLRDSASHSRRFGGSLASRPRRRGVGLRVLATEERRARGDAVPDRVVDLVGPGRRATGQSRMSEAAMAPDCHGPRPKERTTRRGGVVDLVATERMALDTFDVRRNLQRNGCRFSGT
jgi:hypothetical protein